MSQLKTLIDTYGKEKINTLTRYPSILTLHSLGQKGRLTDTYTTDIAGEQLFATEKIDGTNVRIVAWGNEYLIGSRRFILHYSNDLYWDEALGIVDQIHALDVTIPTPDSLTVVFGELFGGKVSSGSKNYGKERHGFRVFDVAVLEDLSILDSSNAEIAAWRESTINSTEGEALRYGQPFVSVAELATCGFELVPLVDFTLDGLDHASVLTALEAHLPTTQVALTDAAEGKAEGVVVRTADRSKIVKLRFEDYQRTLKAKK